MRAPVIITILVLLAAVWFLLDHGPQAPEGISPEAWQAYEEGNGYLESFRYADALEALDKASELAPACAMVQVALAEVYLRTDRRLEGLEAGARSDSLALLITDDRQRSLVQLRLANLGLHRGNRDSLLEVCAQHDADGILVLSTRAGIAAQAGDLERASRYWKLCLEANPNYAAAYNQLGYNAAAMGEYEKAIEYISKYAFVAPDLANPHDSMGDVLAFVGRYEEALKSYRRALEIQPDLWNSAVNIARVYLALGRMEKGSKLMLGARELVATSGLRDYIDGQLLNSLFLNGSADAINEWSRSYIAGSGNAEAVVRVRSYLLAGSGRIDEGLALVDSLFTAMADSAHGGELDEQLDKMYHRARAITLQIAGDFESSAGEWERSLELHSDVSNVHERTIGWTLYAETLQHVDRHSEAREVVERMLRVNPRLLRPLLVHAECALAEGDVTAAAESERKLAVILAKADTDLPAHARLAEIQRRLATY